MKTVYKYASLNVLAVVVLLCGCASHHTKVTNPTEITSVGCQEAGVIYSDGAVVGIGGVVFKCTGGQWKSTGKTCEPDVTFLFQGEALVGNTVHTVGPGQYPVVVSAYQPKYLVFSKADHELRIKNTSSQSILAVYAWTGSAGELVIRHYIVQGNSQVIVKREGVRGQCIGETPNLKY
jgi:hypothetical protein